MGMVRQTGLHDNYNAISGGSFVRQHDQFMWLRNQRCMALANTVSLETKILKKENGVS